LNHLVPDVDERGIDNTMAMNGHLLILIVAVGLFARVWTTNDRQRLPVVWRIQSRATTVAAPRVAVPTEVETPVHAVSDRMNEVAHEEFWTLDNCPIPIPTGLPAGEFRVVDDTGRVARLVVTEPVSAPAADALVGTADLQTMTVESHRWYFIRLNAPVAQRIDIEQTPVSDNSHPVLVIEEPVIVAEANRKFDFTGFTDSINVKTPDTVPEFRPEPPALPESE
jgi:hypothetical protein